MSKKYPGGARKLGRFPPSTSNVDADGNIYDVSHMPWRIIGKVKK